MASGILLTGGSGQLGSALRRALGDVAAPTRDDLDLGDAGAIRRWVRAMKPRWIVNAAAYTAVDRAESEPELAYRVNAAAVRVLGEEAAAVGAAVISFSTDYVFSGDGVRPWVETDAAAALNIYGASKLAGERALAESGAAHVIFRTSWLYGATGKNFLRTMLRMACERERVTVVADQHGAPTAVEDVAALVVHAISRLEGAGGRPLTEAVREAGGVYHACAGGETTWFEFAREIVRLAQLAEPGERFAELVPIVSREYPAAAKRPLNSRMSCERLRREMGFVMPEWTEGLERVMKTIYGR